MQGAASSRRLLLRLRGVVVSESGKGRSKPVRYDLWS